MELKERILSKTSELFLVYGIKNVTMDMLASELGISKRTIYEIFGDKENLVVEFLAFVYRKQNTMRMHIIENAEHSIEAMFQIFRSQYLEHKSIPKVFLEDLKKYIPVMNKRLFSDADFLKEHSSSYKLLEKGVQQGIFRKEINTEMVDLFLQELFPFVMNNERIMMRKCEDMEVFTNIILPYFRGLCTIKGINLIDKYFDNLDLEQLSANRS
jgi:TetR/AcrR family transcriptional regulator, cholesterol catabolism regulator